MNFRVHHHKGSGGQVQVTASIAAIFSPSGASRSSFGASRAALCAALAVLGILALTPASALAATAYVPAEQQFSNGFNFVLPSGIAVNGNNGHIYIAESGSGQVLDYTSASDTSPAVWNGSDTPAGSFGEAPLRRR